jgi:hypothetical protein
VSLPEEELLPAVDLRTLLGEMAALKAEVRTVTVEAREARQAGDESARQLRAELERAAEREDAHRRAADDARRRAARALIDVGDRLEAAVRSARAPVRRRWFARGPSRRSSRGSSSRCAVSPSAWRRWA